MRNVKNFKMYFPYFRDIGLMKFSVFRIVELYFTNTQKIVAFLVSLQHMITEFVNVFCCLSDDKCMHSVQ